MKMFAAAIAVASICLSATAAAADPQPTAQQSRMKACNMEAREQKLEGDARKGFMSDCLKTKRVSQQDKMRMCNQDARQQKLAGNERKMFMSDCLKGDKKA